MHKKPHAQETARTQKPRTHRNHAHKIPCAHKNKKPHTTDHTQETTHPAAGEESPAAGTVLWGDPPSELVRAISARGERAHHDTTQTQTHHAQGDE
eukprot:164346-Alexandrium_andersonii.AAC.1